MNDFSLNYIAYRDESGSMTIPQWVMNALTDLERFKAMPEQVGKLVCGLTNGFNYDDVTKLKLLAADFYTAWEASSTEVAKHLGQSICLELFCLFRSAWTICWPDDSLDWIEENGMDWEMTIYRGESPALVTTGVQGFSWTLSEDIAKYYASRHSDGVVLKATVRFDDVLLINMSEYEFVVSPGKVRMESNTTHKEQ